MHLLARVRIMKNKYDIDRCACLPGSEITHQRTSTQVRTHNKRTHLDEGIHINANQDTIIERTWMKAYTMVYLQ